MVIVLREALVRDDAAKGQNKKNSASQVKSFIQNIHHFRDDNFPLAGPPDEHVVIFDEAQRAWSKDKAADFMEKKKGKLDFDMSEPEYLIKVMDQHTDWAVIICLVGGGQEINTGEAGLVEWFNAIRNHFPNWHVHVSQQLSDTEYLLGKQPADLLPSGKLFVDDRLHLSVSLRSFRSEKVSDLVKAILDSDVDKAQNLYADVTPDYPIFLTRDIQVARGWLRKSARGSERYGLLASSRAIRLRPEGIFVKAKIEVEHWFLDDRRDVRSSFALEGVATEFDIQGLELDWAVVAWDADLRHDGNRWFFYDFRGSEWQNVKGETRQRYLLNSYRVLLTRARQGLVIFVPYGDDQDPTRPPSYYDGTFEYLHRIGLPVI